MSNFLEMPLVLAALAFTAGYVLAKLGAVIGRSPAGEPNSKQDHQLRALEADLRVARKQHEEVQEELTALQQDHDALQAELAARSGELLDATGQLVDVRNQLREECEKTQTLRTELSQRAEQRIRDQVQIRDMQTELSLSQGSGAFVAEQFTELFDADEHPQQQIDEPEPMPVTKHADAQDDQPHPQRRIEDFVDGPVEDAIASPHPMRRSTDKVVS